ncbi:NAD(P)H-dependent flavin oxidoreductase [Denitrobaculum tricleocarpae]|uniref:Propionate 3-nitronate monooxygenase n=1 Tax=Denitrobaculum tricleocarpae TaxID=2591009 RepID=A0A545U361_9PROT|nr:nitronate monooxygenase [Denitrobaculum tricleocarpae]TQV83853.1 nitronate monooxygenase [Denitrobaculum tricleocarpae]
MPSQTEAVRRLGIDYPIIQGPFGGGISTVGLVSAVSNRGGLGSFGAHIVAPEEIGVLRKEIGAATSAPFALNLWVSDHDPGGLHLSQEEFDRYFPIFEPYFEELGLEKPEPPELYHYRFEEQAEALLEARPPVFSFVFGVPSAKVLAECKQRGIVTAGAATTIAEAEALEAAGVDLIVATGFEAGGHRPSFLAPAEESLFGTLALTQIIERRVKVAVIAAGGIVDGRGVHAALTLGAQAAQIGTAFLACDESGTTDAHRALLHGDAILETALSRSFTGRLARVIPNRLYDELLPRAAELPPFPVQGWFVSRIKAAAVAANRSDLITLYSGQIAPNLKHRNVPDLMDALLQDLS